MRYWVIISLFLFACAKEQRNDCLTSLGDVTTVERQLSDFTKIYTEDRIEVELVQDSTLAGRISIVAPENLIPQITSDVIDGELRLTNTNTCNFVRSFEYRIVIKVYFKNIERLSLESIAKASNNDTIFVKSIEIRHSALSDLDLLVSSSENIFLTSINSAHTKLRGKAKALRGSIEEVSDLDARELICEEVLLDSHTPLDCFVNGTKGLYVNIFNSGNIYYAQEPTEYKILNTKTGTGQFDLIK